jgi:hypothetical protein
MRSMCLLLAFSACGDNSRGPEVVPPADSGARDAQLEIDAPPADAARMVRVFGNIDFGGGLDGVTVSVLGDSQSATTDANGNFFVDAPEGSRLILKATAPSRPELFPMIRGVVAQENLRPRVFYMLGPPDVTSATSLGLTFDPNKAIVEVDFRNAEIGGYGATLQRNGSAVVPGFGIAYEDDGDPAASQITVSGGGGSTLLLGDLAVGDATFTPIVPGAATLPCQPRDANPLPLLAGTVTWFDFECGTATD